ncbi:MAG TPA: endonuclease/exonuclease/phosphatase family protein, partial [Anaerolineales bacterium]|nr:endonuclease/exonuclease/phosphatase family protein [Anaerolineales bacterium]
LLLDWLPHTRLPTLVCGDFNAFPSSVSIQKMKLVFASAFEHVHGREPEYTAPTPLPRSLRFMAQTARFFWRQFSLRLLFSKGKGTLDYIFYNSGLTALDADLALNQPASQNKRLFPSDHFGLWAAIDFSERGQY